MEGCTARDSDEDVQKRGAVTKEGVGGGEQDGIASLQRANRKDSKGRKKDADRRPRQAGDAQREEQERK